MHIHFFASLLSFAALHSAQAAPTPWLDLLEPRSTTATTFGVKFGGDDPFENKADESFLPASTAKIIIASAAFERLGEDYQFQTRVEWRREPWNGARISDLMVHGSGDPTWGLSEFGENLETRMKEIALHLQAAGVREIHGPIRFVTTHPGWTTAGVPEGWRENDLVSCYGALPGSYQLALNCMPFTVTGSKTGKWGDPRIQDPVDVQVSEGRVTALSVERGTDGQFSVRGKLATGKTAVVAIPVVRVHLWLEQILRAQLAEASIRLSPATNHIHATMPQTYVLKSVPLRRLVRRYLKQSLNLIGEVLLMKLGEESGASSTASLREEGLRAVDTFLTSLNAAGSITLHDGSGLSRLARVKPAALYRLLSDLTGIRSFESVVSGLSIAGVDGTLRKRLVGTAAAGRFVGKTGTLNGVCNVVGYLPVTRAGTGQWIPVVILGESSLGAAPIRQGADRVISKIAELHRASLADLAPFLASESSSQPAPGRMSIPVEFEQNPFAIHGFSYDPRSSEGITEGNENAPE